MHDEFPRDEFATVSTASGSLRLAYQSFGNRDDPVFLLLTGWFSDLTLWPRGFCEVLAGLGFRVVRYDHRDAGLSTRTDIDVPDPESGQGASAGRASGKGPAGYP